MVLHFWREQSPRSPVRVIWRISVDRLQRNSDDTDLVLAVSQMRLGFYRPEQMPLMEQRATMQRAQTTLRTHHYGLAPTITTKRRVIGFHHAGASGPHRWVILITQLSEGRRCSDAQI